MEAVRRQRISQNGAVAGITPAPRDLSTHRWSVLRAARVVCEVDEMTMRLATLFHCAVALMVPASRLLGQAGTGRTLPLTAEVTAVTSGADGRPVLSVRLRNTSDSSITAYVLNIAVTDSAGRRGLDINQTYITGMGGPGSARSYAPAASWTERIPLPIIPAEGTQHRYEVSVDFVRTTDSKRPDWGPDRAHHSQYILGATAAYRSERMRLRRLVQQKGCEAVIEDLNSAQ